MSRPAITPSARHAAFHRTIWRWHFWAGLLVAPVLLMLSLTGAIYLFNDELNDALYPSLRHVTPRAAPVPVSRMIDAALAAHPGTATRIDTPATPDRSAVVFVTPGQGEPLRVAVDPGTGRVLGSLVYDRTLVGWADAMHRSMLLGITGEWVVELAACWALVLLATGAILWWPRGPWRASGTLWPRLSGRGRRFWRDLHAPVGLWTVALIGFLVVTGLPWAGVTGQMLHRIGAAAGIGYPPSFRQYGLPQSVPMKTVTGEAPWTLEDAPMPQSAMAAHADHMAGMTPSAPTDERVVQGTDQVAAMVRARGWPPAYRLFLPKGPTGVYTVFTYPDRPQGQRTLYVDRYSLRAIGPEVRYADYGVLGKATELGVQLHMGNYAGRPNQLVMLVPCLAIWLLVISGVAMWWTRRPAGRLGAPPPLSGARVRGLLVSLVVTGLVLPLFGASLILVALLDRLAAGWAGRRMA